MNGDRYLKLVQYKVSLDDAWKRQNRLSMFDAEYEKTLNVVKMAGFKVYRNAAGEHKLIDTAKSQRDAHNLEFFADVLQQGM